MKRGEKYPGKKRKKGGGVLREGVPDAHVEIARSGIGSKKSRPTGLNEKGGRKSFPPKPNREKMGM